VERLVNASRRPAKLAPLVRNAGLDAIAQRQADRMRDAGYIFHNTAIADDATAAGVDWMLIGENVGEGMIVEAVEQAFMESEPHKRNILDAEFNALGVGVAWRDNVVYIAQAFARVKRVAPAPTSVPVPSETPRPWVEPPAVETPRVAVARPIPTPRASAPVPPGSVRAEDGSVVPSSYYETSRCLEQGWVGAAFPATDSLVVSSESAHGC
jgi:hypothetical protein